MAVGGVFGDIAADFEEVEADVKIAWTEEQRATLRQKTYEAMRARYEVIFPKNPNLDLAGLRSARGTALAPVAPE